MQRVSLHNVSHALCTSKPVECFTCNVWACTMYHMQCVSLYNVSDCTACAAGSCCLSEEETLLCMRNCSVQCDSQATNWVLFSSAFSWRNFEGLPQTLVKNIIFHIIQSGLFLRFNPVMASLLERLYAGNFEYNLCYSDDTTRWSQLRTGLF